VSHFLKAPRFLKDIRYRAEATGFVGLMGLFRILGLRNATAFAAWVARTFGPVSGAEQRARTNLKLCLPDLSPQDRRALLDAMWSNLGATFAEYAHLDKFRTYRPDARIEISGDRHAIEARDSGRGAIFVSGHFANWELLPLAASGLGLSGAEVYRAPNNPYIDKWLTDRRLRHIYQDQVPKGAAGAKQLIRVLKDNKHIVMLIDQKMNDGIPVPFFGYEAMTAPAAAQLALKFDVPIIRASIRRLPGSRFRITIHPPLRVPRDSDRARAIAGTMTELNRWLEDEIRQCPEQWLWLHRRFPKHDAPRRLGFAQTESSELAVN